jgi:PPM family protein phosphatase
MESKTLKSKFGIVSRTNVGMVRSNNEDFHGYSTNIFEKDWHFYEESVVPVNEKPILLVVADGMGGLEMGEEASRIAVETTKKYFFDNAEEIVKNITVLNQKMNLLFTEINNEILDFAKQSNNEGQTGTTLIISLIIKKKAYIFWIGDSRAYLFRNGSLKPLTKDHSYVQELVDKGKLTYEQSFFHPDSNIITKYMGDPKNTPKPSYVEIALEKGDVLMLCTDGLNGMLQDKDIESVFYESDDLKQICEKLIDNANEVGGNDNNTIILCKQLKIQAMTQDGLLSFMQIKT